MIVILLQIHFNIVFYMLIQQQILGTGQMIIILYDVLTANCLMMIYLLANTTWYLIARPVMNFQ